MIVELANWNREGEGERKGRKLVDAGFQKGKSNLILPLGSNPLISLNSTCFFKRQSQGVSSEWVLSLAL